MKIVVLENTDNIKDVVEIHMRTFKGFFLTFLGRGFLKHLYKNFVAHPDSNLIVALNDDGKIAGFLAYSFDISSFYKYLVKKKLLPFAFYAGMAVIKKPKILLRVFRAFKYSNGSKREEIYVELSSLGVDPDYKHNGVGSVLIDKLKEVITDTGCDVEYIKLETDAVGNDAVNSFYVRNGFVVDNVFVTQEGRKMYECRYYMNK